MPVSLKNNDTLILKQIKPEKCSSISFIYLIVSYRCLSSPGTKKTEGQVIGNDN